jgi:hypothetical protein
LLLDLPCSEKYIIYGLSPGDTIKRKNRLINQDKELIFMTEGFSVKKNIVYGSETSPLIHKNKDAIKAFASYGNQNSESGSYYDELEEMSGHKITPYDIFYKIYPAYYPIVMIYSITLMMFPVFVTEIQSFNFPYMQETQWWSLILLFVYAAMDCVGRIFVGYLPSFLNKDNIFFFSLCRALIIIPIICSVKGIWCRNDFLSIILVSILGSSNGYLGSTSIMLVNEWCRSQEEIGHAGVLTGFVLNGALALGAFSASVIHSYL